MSRELLCELINYNINKICKESHVEVESNFELIKEANFNQLKKRKYHEKLFLLYKETFEHKQKRLFYCSNDRCYKIIPLEYNQNELICDCGAELSQFYNVDEMISEYSEDEDYEYNILTDNNENIIAFSCGKLIVNSNKNTLLSKKHYAIYKSKDSNLSNAGIAISEYFKNSLGESSNYGEFIYFSDAGGVKRNVRNNLKSLILTTIPMLECSFIHAKGRLVSINYENSKMLKLNIALGFEKIAQYGDLVYIGCKNVGPQLFLYKNFSEKEIRNVIKILLNES